MAKTSRAAVVRKPSEDLVIEEYDLPELQPGAAMMKVANAGVCGTEKLTTGIQDN